MQILIWKDGVQYNLAEEEVRQQLADRRLKLSDKASCEGARDRWIPLNEVLEFVASRQCERRNEAGSREARPPPPPQKQSSGVDHHAVLGVSHTASQDQIKAAYRLRMQEYHPTRSPILEPTFARWRNTRRKRSMKHMKPCAHNFKLPNKACFSHSSRAGQLTDCGNSNIIITGHTPLRRLCLEVRPKRATGLPNFLYVDNSNVWIEGMHVAALKNGLAPDLQTALDQNICDHGYKVDFGHLFQFAGGSKTDVGRAVLFGSRPPPNDSLWAAAAAQGFEVVVFDRNVKNREKKIDTSIVTEMVTDSFRLMHAKKDEITLVAGDADYVPAIESLRSRGFTFMSYFGAMRRAS